MLRVGNVPLALFAAFGFVAGLAVRAWILGRPTHVEHLVVIQRLMHHGLLCKLRVCLILVCNKCHATSNFDAHCGQLWARWQRTVVQFAPLGKVAAHDLRHGCLARVILPVIRVCCCAAERQRCLLVDTADVQRAVHVKHGADAAHVVAVPAKLFASKHIRALVGNLVRTRQSV